jgi:CTP:molybdopterin cytidylyltransferase MocA
VSAELALVVLAAGASERLGLPKALVALRPGPGGTPLELLLAAGACLGDPHALVVTGRHHAELAAFARTLVAPPELVHNAGWRAGRTGGVRCAAERRLGRDLCLAPVDVPLVPSEVFAALANEWRRAGRPARGWLGPWTPVGGARRFGHPIVLGRELAHALQDFPPDRPLAELRDQAEPRLALEVASPAILDDLDSPEDLARLRERSP